MPASDAELLQRFTAQHDEAAFAELIGRHGPRVLGVCTRVLQDRQAAEDACQATFLVLARNAASIRLPEALSSWLYGVAYRVAVRLKRSNLRSRETPHGDLQEIPQSKGDPVARVVWCELQPMLDEELNQLPEKYRAPLVLCELEGKSNVEAAAALGWPASSLSSRLVRARELLRGRLVRRGVALSAGMLFPLLAGQVEAAVPPALVGATAKAATLLALGQSAAGEGLSAATMILAEGVMQAMMWNRLKIVAGVLLVVATVGTVAGLGVHAAARRTAPAVAEAPPEEPAKNGPADKPAPPPPVDRVEELGQALAAPVTENTTPAELASRKTNLEKHVQMLQLEDMRRALALERWRDEDRDQRIAAIDGLVRKDLLGRFEKEMRSALERGTGEVRLAAVAQLAEMGVAVRGETMQASAARILAPDLIKLIEGPAGPVREAAALALGKINPEAAPATRALGKLLQADDVAARRAAAEALVSLLRVVRGLLANQLATSVQLSREDGIKMAQAVTFGLKPALQHRDTEVRRFGLQAMQLAGAILAELVVDPGYVPEVLPMGRKPSAEEVEEIRAYRKRVEDERQQLLPFARVLAGQLSAVLPALDDADLAVSLPGHEALEAAATARLRLLRKADRVPLGGLPKPIEDPLQPALRTAVPLLGKQLAHPDVRVRLASLYVLETLEGEAAPVADTVLKALGDANSFVRWGAVRALGRMAPRETAKVVPQLTRALDDENRDVRITAAAALERYGPGALSAAPALSAAVNRKDREAQLLAIQALTAIGPEAIPAGAGPAVATALTDPDFKVRIKAAWALGKFGPAARPAAEALRTALKDPVAEVRQAASDALLAIK